MPNQSDALRKYRKAASSYNDRFEKVLEDARRRNIRLLQLKSGETVIDAGCGTGFNFPMIEEGMDPKDLWSQSSRVRT
jgi:cyclopropane fatty-acyl-phospholipid synthase-like methyltransferase